jgi:hypothetical protein
MNVNQVRERLHYLEGGKFQRLCEDFLQREGYEKIDSTGMMYFTDKVTTGTPDILIFQLNNRCSMCEVTTQENNLFTKLKDDIGKCLDYNKTGIQVSSIDSIIICHTKKMSPEESNQLRDICRPLDIELVFYTLSTISLKICNSYPELALRYLDLALDTGQILTPKDFVDVYSNNQMTTAISNEMLFRDECLKSASSKLEQSNFLLVSGSAGVGKTLFCVNLLSKMKKENPALRTYCILDKGADLNPDIDSRLREPGSYLIFIDDANKLNGRLDYFLYLLHDNRDSCQYRIVASVRDYACESLRNHITKMTEVKEQKLEILNDEQITELTEKLFGITNSSFTERICKISKGNPRLAFMASNVVVKEKSLIVLQNVIRLYHNYFKNYESVLDVLKNKDLLKTAGVLCYLRKVDRQNKGQMEVISGDFDISEEEFWEGVRYLHDLELVNLCEGSVAAVSDQILSTYLFYQAVFVEKVLPLNLLINRLFPVYADRLKDALFPVIDSFDQSEIIKEIRKEVYVTFEIYKKCNSEKNTLDFLEYFWFALPDETLLYLRNFINALSNDDIDWKQEDYSLSTQYTDEIKPVKLLASYRWSTMDRLKISQELLFSFLEKKPDALGCVITLIKDSYSIKREDVKRGFYAHRDMLEVLKQKEGYLYARLLIILASTFLEEEFTETCMNSENIVTIYTLQPEPDEYLKPLREDFFRELARMYNEPDLKGHVQKVLWSYAEKTGYFNPILAKEDFDIFCKNIVPVLNKESLEDCLLIDKLCFRMNRREGADFPEDLKEGFAHKGVLICHLLFEDRDELRSLKLNCNEYYEFRLKRLGDYFSSAADKDLIEFLDLCKDLYSSMPEGRDRDHSLKQGVGLALMAVSSISGELYIKLVVLYQKYQDLFYLDPLVIVKDLLGKTTVDHVWQIITSADYSSKDSWMGRYFHLLDPEEISISVVDNFKEYITKCDSTSLSFLNLDFLLNFTEKDPDIIRYTVLLLVERTSEEIYCAGPLVYLFWNTSKLFNRWFEYLSDEEVQKTYVSGLRYERQYFDCEGVALQILVERDVGFLMRFIDEICKLDKSRSAQSLVSSLDFLWGRENSLEEIESVGRHIFEIEECIFVSKVELFRELFKIDSGEDDHKESKKEFLRYSVERNKHEPDFISFLFSIAKKFDDGFRKELFAIFLKLNNNFSDMQKVNYSLTINSWSGSKVPVLEREKQFLETLLPLLGSTELLEHKLLIRKEIEAKEIEIVEEKKNDFMGRV